MQIYTIDDYLAASPAERVEAKKLVTIENDLERYLYWANSPQGGPVRGEFALGHDHERGLGLHPSEFSKPGVCLKRLYYGVTGELTRDEDASFWGLSDDRRQLIMDTGTMIHLQFQSYLKHMYGEHAQIEVKISDRSRFVESSHIDAVITFPVVRFAFELKSIKEGDAYGFSKVQKKPYPDNLRQCLTYMKIGDCPFGLLYYYLQEHQREERARS